MELEELQKSFLDLQDKFKQTSEEKTSLEKRLEENEIKMKKLQDTNHELFLRITSPAEEKEKQGEEKISVNDIAEQFKKEHKLV